MFKFSLSLRDKSIWLPVTSGSLWTSVIQVKYFKKINLEQWVCCWKKPQKGISNFWVGLLEAFKVYGAWLAWATGDGRAIKVGEDPIIGGPKKYTFSSKFLL